MKVRLKTITPNAEAEMIEMARVSNPANQSNPEYATLLRSCLRRGHWSVFEMANAVVEVDTTRAISAQMIRHRSFTFQEFSQRYADVRELPAPDVPELRSPHPTNRQSSVPFTGTDTLKSILENRIAHHFQEGLDLYADLMESGVAKEVARDVLPLSMPTRLYINGTIRSWIHYLEARTYEGAQKEHREVALAIRDVLAPELPVLARAAGWVS